MYNYTILILLIPLTMFLVTGLFGMKWKPIISGLLGTTGLGISFILSVITAVSYFQSNKGPLIRSIVVRDPLPELNNHFDNGRIEYEAHTLANKIDAYWLVKVYTPLTHQ